MGRYKLDCLLLALIWIQVTFWLVKTQDSNVTTIETTDQDKVCSWSIDGNGREGLQLFWSGNASADSRVIVDAKKLSSGDPNCKYGSIEADSKFSQKSVYLKVCPNVEYEITIHFDCSTPETNKTVWTPPPPPQDVTIENVGNTSFTVSWKMPSLSDPIEHYNVLFYPNGSIHLSEDRNSTLQNTTISGLKPYTLYYVKVTAVNRDFWGEYSEELEVITRIGTPFAPENVEFISVTNTSVALKWDQPTISTGPIVGYRVRWRNWNAEGEVDTLPHLQNITLNNLTPWVKYGFTVLAITNAGPGKWSQERRVQTNIGIPHGPTNISISSVTSTSVRIKWYTPFVSTGPIVSYRVHWKNSSGEGEEDTWSKFPSYTAERLTPNVQYTFKVLALTGAGPGEWSSEVTVQTKDDTSDPCNPEPCQNGGKCSVLENDFRCTCTEYFTGKYCENVSDLCIWNFCQNGGICKVKESGETECFCKAPYGGKRCETRMVVERSTTIFGVVCILSSVVLTSAICLSLFGCQKFLFKKKTLK